MSFSWRLSVHSSCNVIGCWVSLRRIAKVDIHLRNLVGPRVHKRRKAWIARSPISLHLHKCITRHSLTFRHSHVSCWSARASSELDLLLGGQAGTRHLLCYRPLGLHSKVEVLCVLVSVALVRTISRVKMAGMSNLSPLETVDTGGSSRSSRGIGVGVGLRAI